MRICPHCGFENHDRWERCLGCGAPFASGLVDLQDVRRRRPKGPGRSDPGARVAPVLPDTVVVPVSPAPAAVEAVPLGPELSVAIHPFRARRILARWGESRFYLATGEAETEAEAAWLKVIPLPETTDGVVVRERFLREVQIHTAGPRPYVPEILDAGFVEERQAFLLLRASRGRQLAARLADERRPRWSDILRLAHAAAEALEFLHRFGIVHRNVTPETLFVASVRPQVRFWDFGLASWRQRPRRLTPPGTILGLPSHAAPECWRPTPTDHRVDIYALGCVLYEMVAGRPPGATARELAELPAGDPRLRWTPFFPVRGVAPAFGELVRRMLRRDPSNRPASCDAVAAELKGMLGGR